MLICWTERQANGHMESEQIILKWFLIYSNRIEPVDYEFPKNTFKNDFPDLLKIVQNDFIFCDLANFDVLEPRTWLIKSGKVFLRYLKVISIVWHDESWKNKIKFSKYFNDLVKIV